MKSLLTFLLSAFLLSPSAHAILIVKVKDSKALVDLEETDAKEGQEFYVLNETGEPDKEKVLKVLQVKNGRAIMQVVSGTPEEGQILSAKATKKKKKKKKLVVNPDEEGESSIDETDSYYRRYKKSKTYNSWGVLGEYIMFKMNTSSASNSDGSSSTIASSMSGSNFGVLGFYDYSFYPKMIARFSGGYEIHKAVESGNASCPGSNCTFSVNYLSGYGSFKYIFLESPYRFWGSIGAGLLYAMSKSSTAVNESQITYNWVYLIYNLGMDIPLSKKNYIPIIFEMGSYPSSGTVSANMTVLKAGYGWNF